MNTSGAGSKRFEWSVEMNNTGHKWDMRFLELAKMVASWSKDPSTKVGAVIVGPDMEIRSTGINGFPRGVEDTEARLTNREEKLSLVVHAEMNAILNAVRFGIQLKGCTMYVAATDQSGAVWGGPPCTRCTVEVLQSGIATIVSYPKKFAPSRWHASLAAAESLLEEVGVKFIEVQMLEPKRVYEHLLPGFLKAMNDIGRYGHEKYKDASFQDKILIGNRERDARTEPQVLADHAREHFSMYLNHIEHDYFHDDIHQLAAAAFNCMMEAYYAGLEGPK